MDDEGVRGRVIARNEATKQSIKSETGNYIDCFATLAMTE